MWYSKQPVGLDLPDASGTVSSEVRPRQTYVWVRVRTLFFDGPQTLTRLLRGFPFQLNKKSHSLPTPPAAWEEAAAGEEVKDWVSDGRTPGGLVLREVGA